VRARIVADRLPAASVAPAARLDLGSCGSVAPAV